MGLFRSLGSRKDATRGTTAIEVRKGLEGIFTGPGVLPGGTTPLVTGSAGWAYTVRAAHFVTKRATGDGVHLFGNDGDVTVGSGGVGTTVTAAPGVGLSRIDIIWVRGRSASENSDTVSDPEFGVTVGTPAASPIAPSIPTGALELARNTMTSSATSTASAGNTIAQTAAAARLVGESTPAKSVRSADETFDISTWSAAAAITSYQFEAGGWYLVTATGSVSIGGSASELLHRVRAATLETSAQWPVTMATGTKYALSGHLLFQASSTATVAVLHEVNVPAPATGVVVRAGHTVSVARVA